MDVVCKEFDHKVVVVGKSDFEALQTENEQLKQKLHEYDPMPDYKELLKELYSTEDVEKLEWTLNHICGGQASVNGWRASSKFWNGRYKDLLKLVGFSSKKEAEDYLVNEAECDTLHEAISKLKDQVKYTCDEWYSANSSNNSWKAAAECNSPKELKAKLNLLLDNIEEWKEVTGYPSPSRAKNAIESGASWHQAYRDVKATNEKLADDVKSWKNVTGYSTPEDYMHARISGAFHTPFDYTTAWQKFTGCDSPQKAGCKINSLCDDICKLKGDYDRLLKLTGEQICGRDLRHNLQVDLEYYRSLSSAQAKSIYSWREATGCNTPEEAETTIRNLRGRIDEMKEFASIASNWTDRIVEG